MKLLTIHADYIKYEAKKKAIKDAEAIEKGLHDVPECLVVFTSVEKGDEGCEEAITKHYIKEIVNVATQVKTDTIVLYPYVHLTHEPSNPKSAVKVLDLAEAELKKNYKVFRSPFGWYKAFEIKAKGHPLSELSRSFSPEDIKEISADKKEPKAGIDDELKVAEKQLTDAEKINATLGFMILRAVKELHPESQPGTFGFHLDQVYVDISNVKLKNEDLDKIQQKVRELAKKKLPIEKTDVITDTFQESIRDELPKAQAYTLDSMGLIPFFDDPFLKSTNEVGAYQMLYLGSAYWKNNAANEQLTRIYAVGFRTKEELQAFKQRAQDAEKNDHKKLGKELEIFMLTDSIGKGLPIFLPKGEIIRREIENLAVETEKKYGYVRVSTPHLAKQELFQTSGHLPYYKDSMYPPMKMDDGTYYLKAMNCPMHHLVFNHRPRSYREMPLRVAEYGTCYRNELSGTLAGLLRVRMLSMNDAHIYCTLEQIEQEFESVMKMVLDYYKLFGLKGFWFRLSLRDKKNKEKYIHEPLAWDTTEEILRNVLRKLKCDFVEVSDEAAFYGPKVDIQYKAITGREETLSTIQLDFAAKKRFNLNYMDNKGRENNEVYVIHRAPLSVHERFIAFLIEHYAGKFPLWMSPVQVKIVTVTNRSLEFATEVASKLEKENIRVEVDDRTETIGRKVREAQLAKTNYIVTIGDKEVEKKTLAVRGRDNKVAFDVKVDSFVKELLEEISTKAIK